MARAALEKKKQRNLQVFDFAIEARGNVIYALRENAVIVTSAAMLAFAALPREQQMDYVRTAREKMLAMAPTE